MSNGLPEKLRAAFQRFQAQDLAGAERLCGEALGESPRHPGALHLLGMVLGAQGRMEEALASFQKVLSSAPGSADAHYNVGTALKELGRHEAAAAAYHSALAIEPGNPDTLSNLGIVLAQLGRIDEAIECYHKALARDPRHVQARNNLGNALRMQGKLEAAAENFETILAAAPGFADAMVNLGTVRAAQGRFQEARALYERAIRNDPGSSPDARLGIATLHLLNHEFEPGWKGYDLRLDCPEMRQGLRKSMRTLDLFRRLPRWRGPLEEPEHEVAIWAEQGIGDQVLFSTLIPELLGAGVRFLYEVDPRLLGAYKRAFPGARFVALGEPPAEALQRAGRVLLAGSLPGFFRADRGSFARQVRQVLTAPPGRAAHYRAALKGHAGIKVAVSWKSARADWWGSRKTVELMEFSPLLGLRGATFVDVQYGDTSEERSRVEEATGVRMVRFEDVDHYHDLEELLAILDACDLLVTTSNATAHFAGALGKRTWLLYTADRPPFHYWAHGGGHRTLWYPAVEVVTAPQLSDWTSLAEFAAAKLANELD